MAAQASFPGLRKLGWAGLVLAITLYMTVSALTLANLGVHYDLPGGSPLAKLHPGTWLLSMALLLALAGQGHPIAQLIELVRRLPAIGLYIASMLFLAVWVVWRHGTGGAAFIVDTLWMPGIALLVLALQSTGQRRWLLGWMLVLVGANAALGLVEYYLRTPLFSRYPYDPTLIPDAGYFRSSALLGHPLANSLVTITLLPAAWLLAGWRRWLLLALMSLSLLAFGSRTGLAMLGVYGVVAAGALLLQALRGRYSYRQIAGGLLAITVLVTAGIGTVLATGLGERIFASMKWDNSAQVRLVAWDALDYLDTFDWWMGVPPARIDQIAIRLGLDPRFEAIENFWVVLLMQCGLLGFVPFLIGLLSALVYLLRVAAPPMRWALPVFLLVSSGANTLASKSVSLTLLFVAMAASAAWLRPPMAATPAPNRMPSWREAHP